MPAYQYEALYANGETASGVVEAVTETAAVAQIRQTYAVVLTLTQVKSAGKNASPRGRRVDGKALSLVCRQFSIILKAGLPLVQTVDLVAGQTADRTLRDILRQASEDVSNGWSLSYSFTQRGQRRLPVTFIETVRSGEESGDLVGAFARMSDYYDRMQKTRAKAVSALIYPAFVLAVAVVVVGVIMVYAIPTFAKTFESMDMELPLVTKILIATANFTQKYILHMIALLAAALFALRLYGGTEEGGRRLSRLQLALPIVGKISQMAGGSQFAHTMSTMLSAGMPILQALEVSARAMSNVSMGNAIAQTIPGVEGGRSLGECMSLFPELPQLLVQMTAVGEATGSLEATLGILAEYYDNEVDTLTAKALSLLEPIIIVFLAVIVVTLLLAVYLPMFSMYGAM